MHRPVTVTYCNQCVQVRVKESALNGFSLSLSLYLSLTCVSFHSCVLFKWQSVLFLLFSLVSPQHSDRSKHRNDRYARQLTATRQVTGAKQQAGHGLRAIVYPRRHTGDTIFLIHSLSVRECALRTHSQFKAHWSSDIYFDLSLIC